jgi:hypothetical protein
LYPEGNQGYIWAISAVKNTIPCSGSNSTDSLELKLHRKWMEEAFIVDENCRTALKYSLNRENEILECLRKIRLATEAGISSTEVTEYEEEREEEEEEEEEKKRSKRTLKMRVK